MARPRFKTTIQQRQQLKNLKSHRKRHRCRKNYADHMTLLSLLTLALTIHHASSQYKPAMQIWKDSFEDENEENMITLDDPVGTGHLDDDKALEEYALLRRNAKRQRNAKRAKNVIKLEEAAPELNSWLLNTTEPNRMPDWKKDLLKFYEDGSDSRDDREQVERGTFSLPEFLKKTDVATKSDVLPAIYRCSERKRKSHELACCIGKDTECFTDGGCFCDESCQQYDDCCPDYSDTCAEILSLCLTTAAPPSEGAPKNAPKKPATDYYSEASSKTSKGPGARPSKGGGQPARLEPNRCCGQRPYNDGEECCCNSELVDVPCGKNPCEY